MKSNLMLNPENKKRTLFLFFLCALAFVILYAIVNIEALSAFFGTILSVLSPIIIGACIAYLLNPLLHFYEFKVFKKIKRKGVLRGLSLFMTFFTVIVVIIFFLGLFLPALISSISTLVSKMDDYLIKAIDVINQLLGNFFADGDSPIRLDKYSVIQAVSNIFSASGSILETAVNYITGFGLDLIDGIKNAILSIFITVYILISKERLRAQFHKLTVAFLPGKVRLTIRRYLHLADHTFGDYFIGVILDACFVMCLSLVVFLIFGIPHALFVSVIIGITNIIPIFGPFIGGIPSFLIIFLADPPKAFLFILLILIIQQLDGNVIAPKILGNSTRLSSLGVIIAITIMGAYFGIVGMIIGVPIFSMLVSIITEIINSRLKKANLPTDTAEYFAHDSLVDPREQHERVLQRLGRSISALVQKAFRVSKGAHTKQAKGNQTEASSDEDKDDTKQS